MSAITVPALVAEVRHLATEQPEFVYVKLSGSHCLNRDDPATPGCGCIIGQALDALDPTWFKIELNGSDVGEILDVLGVAGFSGPNYGRASSDYGALCWLRTVQYGQDDGQPWGAAVRRADEYQPIS